jgi:hypothetical protein
MIEAVDMNMQTSKNGINNVQKQTNNIYQQVKSTT